MRRGNVYTEIITDCSVATLQSIIKGKASIDTISHSDGWRENNGLVDFGHKKHFRVHHGKNEFARGKSHINGTKSFGVMPKLDLASLEE